MLNSKYLTTDETLSVFGIEIESPEFEAPSHEHIDLLAGGQKCAKCGGSGRYTKRLPCFACKGTGKVAPAIINREDFAAAHPDIVAWVAANPTFGFAVAMGEQISKFGRLSPNVIAAVRRCMERSAKAPDYTDIDVTAIQHSFDTAHRNGLKRPKLRIGEFVFSRAPDSGRNAGAIYVKSGEQYLGKVFGGKLSCVEECTPDQKSRIAEASASPIKAAIAHGKVTGCCACCGLELTNPESIARGIGPICAEKYGW